MQRIFRGVDDRRKCGGGGDDPFVVLLVRRVGGVSVDGVTGGQPPAVRPETFIVFGVADTVGAVD